MSIEHHFYIGASDSDYDRAVVKGGETENPYTRLKQYGTGAHRDNPFRFRAVISIPITDKKVIKTIEKKWLGKFNTVESDEEDDDNLNCASTIEGICFTSLEEIKDAFISVLKEINLQTLPIIFHTTDNEINELLREYRSKTISQKKSKSLSGVELRPYQEEDIASTQHALLEEKEPRGYWSIECGLGKTLMAFELILRMFLPRNIFVVSRNTLLYQALRDFLKWGYPVKQLFLCNGSSIPADLQPVTRIKSFDQLPKDSSYICVVTYDSLIKLTGANVSFIVFDEGHHLVPSGNKNDLSGNLFGLSDDNIKSRFRLAITATPKDTPLMNTEDGTISLKGMSHQPELYGKCMAERNYLFGRDNGFLSPFEVVCLKTLPTEIRRVVENLRIHLKLPKGTFREFLAELIKWENGRSRYLTDSIEKNVIETEDPEDAVIPGDLILWYAIIADMLIQNINKYICRRIVTYHTTKRRAELFKQVFGIVWNLRKMPETFMCETVHSGNKEEVNENTKKRFKDSTGPHIRILCNIRTLVEGFDEPSIDTTVFVDNKWSAIEAKQIVGRGNRKDPLNTTKIHRVLIPFLAYETEETEDRIVIRTSNDYKTVRYTIKNIILSADPNQSIAQTVWIPRPRDTTERDEEEEEIDETERVWIDEAVPELHDQDLLGSCPTKDLAEQSFYKARLWMHELAQKLKWSDFTTEAQIIQAWNRFRETHLLPKGIPHDPSKIYRKVGWINWRDYTGLLTKRDEYQELHVGELLELLNRKEVNIFDHTLTTLRTVVESKVTRKLPQNPRNKWKISVYDLAERSTDGCTRGVKGWGKYPDSLYSILQREGIVDSLDFERLWPTLHEKYPDFPGIPTDVYGDTFWANYEP